MTVKELKILLEQFDENLPVCYSLYSEYELLEANDLEVKKLQPPRPDGWIACEWGPSPKLPTINYLVFPGN